MNVVRLTSATDVKADALQQFDDAGWLWVDPLIIFLFGDTDHRWIAAEKNLAGLWIVSRWPTSGESVRRKVNDLGVELCVWKMSG